jgi:hypothetical protein
MRELIRLIRHYNKYMGFTSIVENTLGTKPSQFPSPEKSLSQRPPPQQTIIVEKCG